MFELIFITSSTEKLAHARFLCRDYSIRIVKQKNYGVGYEEPRVSDRKLLLERSINDAIHRFKKYVSNPEEKFFFIEDTSVIIDALSIPEEEIPGVNIKFWMKKNTFSKIDGELKKRGNNREVTVRSDIILVIPEVISSEEKEDGTIHFTSSSSGTITTKEIELTTQPLYPWLNNRTFNKWFIPDGCEEPISALDIEIAERHDFRYGAFAEMLTYLEKRQVIRKKNTDYRRKPKQTTIFDMDETISSIFPRIFLVCGPTCAGKTTLAQFLVQEYDYYHIEASDFMYLSFWERHGLKSEVEIGDFAKEVLKINPDIVVKQIINHLKGIENYPFIITGFRDPKEIDFFHNHYEGELYTEEIFIDASQEIRFERNKKRNRDDREITIEKFHKKGLLQERIGLKKIKEMLIDSIVMNEKSKEEFFKSFLVKFNNQLEIAKGEKNKPKIPKSFLTSRSLENAIIISLFETQETRETEYVTTTEISHLINSLPRYQNDRKNKNNISRYFNQNFHPYYEVKLSDGKIRYRLSNTGISRAEWLIRHLGS